MFKTRNHSDNRSLAARPRAGITILELIIVMAISGILVTMFWKPVNETFNESKRRTATRELAVYVARARAASVQRSRQTWFVRSGNIIKIVTDSSGVKVPYGAPLDLATRHGVALTASKDSISFDARGFSTLTVPTPRFIITGGGAADTVCITGLGVATTRTCT